MRTGRRATLSADETEYEAVYQVITTSANDGPAVVALASGIPSINSIYSLGNETDTGARVNRIVPDQDRNNPLRWEVTVTWNTRAIPPNQATHQNPTLRPNIIRWRMEPYEEVMQFDAFDLKVVTANGEWFDPQPVVTRYRPVVSIEKNFATFNDTLMFDYVGSVNSDNWLSGEEGMWLCRVLDVEPLIEQNIAYKRVRAEMIYNYNTWELVLPHKGTLYRANSATTSLTFDPGRPLVFLDSTGVKITQASATTLEFRPYRTLSFNALNLL